MCYHVKGASEVQLLTFSEKSRLRLDYDASNYVPYFHVSGFSHPYLPVVADGHISMMRWGLIPGWARTPEKAREIQNRTLNCVGEEAFEKASYKNVIGKNRGALLVAGFYEWRDFQKTKYPYYIHGEDVLALGCIFTNAADPDTGELIKTFSIVTTAASPMMAQIHNTKKRMPLVLSDWRSWLCPMERPDIEGFMQPSAVPLEAYTISNRLNRFQREQTNVEEITEPVNYPELPPL